MGRSLKIGVFAYFYHKLYFREIFNPFYERGWDDAHKMRYLLILLLLFKEAMDTVLERIFQAKLIKDLKLYFPGCIVLKNDPNYIQGMPDLTVLYNNHWALLEVKNSSKASRQPNQEFYISKAKEMSYGAFIFPENKETILNEMAESFKPKGTARVPVRK